MYPIITSNKVVKMTETFWSMADGIKLYTRITVPALAEKCPVVVIRTPYEAAHHGQAHRIEDYSESLFIKNGYAVVEQHCRGTGDSEGVMLATHEEREDGLSTLGWIRKLPCYNGEIYLFGQSYLASVHYAYLDTNPEDVKGAALFIQADRLFYRNYRNGCNHQYGGLEWRLRTLKKLYPDQKVEGNIVRPFKDLMKRILGEDVPDYTQSLMNDTYTDYWKRKPATYCMDHLKIPVLLAEGWYDSTIDGMFSMWSRIPEETKKKSTFIVGPWPHAVSVSEAAEYPMPSGNIATDFGVEWFNSIRDNTTYKYARCGMVNYYSVGGDYWASTVYSKQDAVYDKWYFSSGKLLSRQPSLSPYEFSYVYDPDRNPEYFRWVGRGKDSDILKAKAPNSVDGIFSFESPVFESDVSYFGIPRWHMQVCSDCEDTMFFARLYFVEGDEAYNLTDAVTSISHWNPEYVPGEKLLFDIEFGHIAFTIKKGGRIRVDISSYSAAYVPHANVRGHWAEVVETKIANNTIICDEEAYLLLPIEK